MSLLVIGTVAFDEIETPFAVSDKILGGAATYAALSASFLTKKVNVVSVIGHDFPEEYLELMRAKGIDTNGIERKPEGKTFYWKGRYHTDLNRRDTLVTELNVLADFQPKIPEAYQDADFLMLGNLTPAIQRSVIESLRTRPRLIAMDTMNFWMETAMDDLKQTLKLVDLLTINDEEARQLSGEYSLVKAAAKILEMGPQFLIIKKGENGALLFHERKVFFAPALPLEEVFDPTGAGDTFAGGFIGFLAHTGDVSFENMKRAIIYGSAMASFSVEKFGVERLNTLTRDELDDRIRTFLDLMLVDITLE